MSGVRAAARSHADLAGLAGAAAAPALVACLWTRPIVLITSLAITCVAVSVARTDLASRRIPNEHVVTVASLTTAAAIAAWVLGSSPWPILLGAATAGGPVLLFHLASPAGMGFGDVKWATVLGGAVGLVAWPQAILVPLVGSLLAIATAAITRQRRMAFAPALSAGALAAVTLGHLVAGGLR